MAISVVHHSNYVEDTSGTVTSITTDVPWASTTGNLLLAGGDGFNNPTEAATPWTDSGSNAWTHAQSTVTSPNNDRCALAFAKNINGTASQTATYAFTATGNYPAAGLIEVSGCDPTNPNDVAATFSAPSSELQAQNSPLITPPAGDHIIFGVGVHDGTVTVTNNGTGSATWTTIANNSGAGQPGFITYAIVTCDGTSTYGFHADAGSGGHIHYTGIAAFKGLPAPIGKLVGPMQNTPGLVTPQAVKAALPW